jgi:hypothetical protein
MECFTRLRETLQQADNPPSPDFDVATLPVEWRIWREERAAIHEFDDGMTRTEAEFRAIATLMGIRLQPGGDDGPIVKT